MKLLLSDSAPTQRPLDREKTQQRCFVEYIFSTDVFPSNAPNTGFFFLFLSAFLFISPHCFINVSVLSLTVRWTVPTVPILPSLGFLPSLATNKEHGEEAILVHFGTS